MGVASAATKEGARAAAFGLGGNSSLLSVRIPKGLHGILKKLSEESGRSFPEEIRRALDFYAIPELLGRLHEIEGGFLELVEGGPPEEPPVTFADIAAWSEDNINKLNDILELCETYRQTVDTVQEMAQERKRLLVKAQEEFRRFLSELRSDQPGGEQLDL